MMSATTAVGGDNNNCKRCVEGLVQVNIESNGDGSFSYDVDCNELISNLDVTNSNGDSADLNSGAENSICQDIGTHAIDSAGPWLWAPQIGPVGPPPPKGTKFCLEFGVSQCYQFETDSNNNTKITGRDYNNQEAFGTVSTC